MTPSHPSHPSHLFPDAGEMVVFDFAPGVSAAVYGVVMPRRSGPATFCKRGDGPFVCDADSWALHLEIGGNDLVELTGAEAAAHAEAAETRRLREFYLGLEPADQTRVRELARARDPEMSPSAIRAATKIFMEGN